MANNRFTPGAMVKGGVQVQSPYVKKEPEPTEPPVRPADDLVPTDSLFSHIDFSDLALSEFELKFVGNLHELGMSKAPEAYISAGGGATNKAQAMPKALSVMSKPHVREAIRRYTKAIIEPAIERAAVLFTQFYEARAFWEPTMFFNDDGSVKPLSEIPSRYHLCIDGIKVDYKGKSEHKITEYTMADRQASIKALQSLFKEEKPAVPVGTGAITDNIRNILEKARKKTTLTRVTETIEVAGEEDSNEG